MCRAIDQSSINMNLYMVDAATLLIFSRMTFDSCFCMEYVKSSLCVASVLSSIISIVDGSRLLF